MPRLSMIYLGGTNTSSSSEIPNGQFSQRWALDPELIQINYPSVVITKKYCQCKSMGSSAITFTHLWRAWHSIANNFNSEAIRNEYPNIPLHTRNVYVLTIESADKTLLRSWKHSEVGIPHNQKRMADNHVTELTHFAKILIFVTN